MNIGAEKGQHIVNLINECKISSMIELGVDVGYSAILFGDALADSAGLRDTVRIIIRFSDEVLQELVEDEQLEEVELIFLDHWQDLYLLDLWLLEQMDVSKPDISVVIADNLIIPGAPRYRTWVEATTKQKREMVKGAGIGAVMPNPDLVHETVLPEFENDLGHDGVAVTGVVGDSSIVYN
ncbi:hypothetical protein N7490_011894 [Penicillium lividum]|nr:hypothetical protein N7490_011894 [Penicillium lividum]